MYTIREKHRQITIRMGGVFRGLNSAQELEGHRSEGLDSPKVVALMMMIIDTSIKFNINSAIKPIEIVKSHPSSQRLPTPTWLIS